MQYQNPPRAFTAEATLIDCRSQVITLQNTGADVLISVATPKFARQIIRKVADMNWKPLHLLTNVSTSVGAGPARMNENSAICPRLAATVQAVAVD